MVCVDRKDVRQGVQLDLSNRGTAHLPLVPETRSWDQHPCSLATLNSPKRDWVTRSRQTMARHVPVLAGCRLRPPLAIAGAYLDLGFCFVSPGKPGADTVVGGTAGNSSSTD